MLLIPSQPNSIVDLSKQMHQSSVSTHHAVDVVAFYVEQTFIFLSFLLFILKLFVFLEHLVKVLVIKLMFDALILIFYTLIFKLMINLVVNLIVNQKSLLQLVPRLFYMALSRIAIIFYEITLHFLHWRGQKFLA